jgi:hypothetical protein
MLYQGDDPIGSQHIAGGRYASNGKGIDVRGEVVDLLLEKIASDRNPSVTMMNMVEELLAPDDVAAYVAVLMDKVKTDRYPSYSMLRRLLALAS